MAVESLIFQQIVDANFDQAIYTASPNNTINVVQIAAKGSGTNIALALTPKGTGYISAQVPDGTTAGGNARGPGAMDFQILRTAANQVASGDYSAVLGGQRNRASGFGSCTLAGLGNTVTGAYSIAGGNSCSAPGESSYSFGAGSSAAGQYSRATGRSCSANANYSASEGWLGLAHVAGHNVYGCGGFTSAAGEAQRVEIVLRGRTTTDTQVELQTVGATLFSIRSGTVIAGTLQILGAKSDGSVIAEYMRRVAIKRIGNTTSLVFVNTIGTDTASGTSISITADDTNDALSVGVTGVSGETWRWDAVFYGLELAYGT